MPDLKRMCKDFIYFELRDAHEKELLTEQVQQFRRFKTVDLLP